MQLKHSLLGFQTPIEKPLVIFLSETAGLPVIALGAGLAVWGVVNLLEGYGSDNAAANAHVW